MVETCFTAKNTYVTKSYEYDVACESFTRMSFNLFQRFCYGSESMFRG